MCLFFFGGGIPQHCSSNGKVMNFLNLSHFICRRVNLVKLLFGQPQRFRTIFAWDPRAPLHSKHGRNIHFNPPPSDSKDNSFPPFLPPSPSLSFPSFLPFNRIVEFKDMLNAYLFCFFLFLLNPKLVLRAPPSVNFRLRQ